MFDLIVRDFYTSYVGIFTSSTLNDLISFLIIHFSITFTCITLIILELFSKIHSHQLIFSKHFNFSNSYFRRDSPRKFKWYSIRIYILTYRHTKPAYMMSRQNSVYLFVCSFVWIEWKMFNIISTILNRIKCLRQTQWEEQHKTSFKHDRMPKRIPSMS